MKWHKRNRCVMSKEAWNAIARWRRRRQSSWNKLKQQKRWRETKRKWDLYISILLHTYLVQAHSAWWSQYTTYQLLDCTLHSSTHKILLIYSNIYVLSKFTLLFIKILILFASFVGCAAARFDFSCSLFFIMFISICSFFFSVFLRSLGCRLLFNNYYILFIPSVEHFLSLCHVLRAHTIHRKPI